MTGHWRCREHLLPVGRRTLFMAIVNVTPDSFSGDGILDDVGAAVEAGMRAAADGADVLDIGGESTRPNAAAVDADEERRRVVPVVRRLARELTIPISVDTSKPAVAAAALEAGAHLINDVSGLALGDELGRHVAAAKAGLVVMRFPGFPRNSPRRRRIEEGDLLAAVGADLRRSVDRALAVGVAPDGLAVDPGFGFGILAADSIELLRRLGELRNLGYPLLVGVSRKSFTGQPEGLPVDERHWGTAAAHALAIAHGADILRVHDVTAARRTGAFADLVERGPASADA